MVDSAPSFHREQHHAVVGVVDHYSPHSQGSPTEYYRHVNMRKELLYTKHRDMVHFIRRSVNRFEDMKPGVSELLAQYDAELIYVQDSDQIEVEINKHNGTILADHSSFFNREPTTQTAANINKRSRQRKESLWNIFFSLIRIKLYSIRNRVVQEVDERLRKNDQHQQRRQQNQLYHNYP